MEIKSHTINNVHIAEVISDNIVIYSTEDGKDLMGEVYYQGFDGLILHADQLVPDFFDLKNGMAGEILQKFSTYRIRLVIVGDFDQHSSKSLKDFIYESNHGRHVNFLKSREEALSRLSR